VAVTYDGHKTVLKKVPLKNVAGKTRHMPDDFMQADANQLSEKGMAYLKRLVPEKHKVGKPFV
jgi:6-phosphofructokinase 1